MLNVNTIEFNGRKACINSFSDLIHVHPALMEEMTAQIDYFSHEYPNATVKTERLTDMETVALVKQTRTPGNDVWDIGNASKGSK
jgi:hypothetical protein